MTVESRGHAEAGRAPLELPDAENYSARPTRRTGHSCPGPSYASPTTAARRKNRPDLPLPKNANLLPPRRFPASERRLGNHDVGRPPDDRRRSYLDRRHEQRRLGDYYLLRLSPPYPLELVAPGDRGLDLWRPVIYTTDAFETVDRAGRHPHLRNTGGGKAAPVLAPGGNAWLLRGSGNPDQPELVRIRSSGSDVQVFPFARIPRSTVESISFVDADNGWGSSVRTGARGASICTDT